jgi:hypothetical protein
MLPYKKFVWWQNEGPSLQFLEFEDYFICRLGGKYGENFHS